ncbi:MAG TPA: DNA-binding response regulator [Azonexus sp.]|nr:DNA-binding response regulator [Azonexus sp.]
MLTATPSHNNRSDKQCILLVDDSPEEQRRVLDLLRPYYRTIVAFNGEQGYQRALASQPDLILMDVRMPKTDGYSSCRLLKADPQTRDIPVIFLSSAHSPDERIEGLTVGGVDYVTKPYVAEEILARIRIHLDLSRRIGSAAPAEQDERTRNPNEVMVTAAKQLIAQHLQAPLPLAEIARRIGTYEKKLLQTFRAQTGLTVFGFIREERIRHACHLLEKTDMSILDIADQVGFQRAANFTTAFRERMGMTPTTYRQSLRKDFLPDAD